MVYNNTSSVCRRRYNRQTMTEKEILNKVKEYFSIKELVSKKVYRKYGERAWRFIDIKLLHTLLVIRIELDRAIIINNWHYGGKFKQRGLRTNMSYIVLSYIKKAKIYVSGHVLGKAIDFNVKGMTSLEFRNWIKENEHILPYKIRLEKLKGGKFMFWVHLDVISEEKNGKIYTFIV